MKTVPAKLLGVRITLDEGNATLDRQLYAQGIVVEGISFVKVRRADNTLLAPGNDLSAHKDDEAYLGTSRSSCTTIVGNVTFLAGMTRPGLCSSVRELGRLTTSPCLKHWRRLQHVRRYVPRNNTRPLPGLRYDKERRRRCQTTTRKPSWATHSDSDQVDDARSRGIATGYLLTPNNSPHRLKVQVARLGHVVMLSRFQVDWTVVVQGMRHCLYTRGILGELALSQDTTPLGCSYGNRGATQAATTTGFNQRAPETRGREIEVQAGVHRVKTFRLGTCAHDKKKWRTFSSSGYGRRNSSNSRIPYKSTPGVRA